MKPGIFLSLLLIITIHFYAIKDRHLPGVNLKILFTMAIIYIVYNDPQGRSFFSYKIFPDSYFSSRWSKLQTYPRAVPMEKLQCSNTVPSGELFLQR
jgi:hypothetical protein